METKRCVGNEDIRAPMLTITDEDEADALACRVEAGVNSVVEGLFSCW